MTSILEIYREGKELAEIEQLVHGNIKCARDIENSFCVQCEHLRDRMYNFYNSWPGWLLVLNAIRYFIENPKLTIRIFRSIWREQRMRNE